MSPNYRAGSGSMQIAAQILERVIFEPRLFDPGDGMMVLDKDELLVRGQAH